MQGGFGGGHGSLDQLIFAVGLPAVLATIVLRVWPGDFLAFVIFPAIVNIGLWFMASRAFLAIRRKRV